MATPFQSIDPALLALQTAKKAMPASPNTQAVAKPSLNVPKQQPQAISTNITPPTAKIGGISSPYGATNINSSPVLGGATPQEIGTRATQLQSLPKAIPQTGSQPKTGTDNQKYIDLQIDIKKGMPFEKMKELYSDIPESAQSDLYNDLKKGMPIEKIPELYPELLQGSTTIQNVAGGLVQSATGIPSLGAKIANPIFGAVDKYIVDPLSRVLGVDESKIQANTARAQQARSNIIGGLDTAGQKLTGGDPESTAFKTAKLVGDIGQTIITPNAPGLTKGAGLLKGAGQLAGQGLAETVKYSAIADQRLPTKEELAYGVGGNVLIGGAIAGAPQAIKAIKGFKPIESIARKITGTADDYGKLFKSAEPRTNQLNKAVDYKNLQKNHNIASEEIVKAGYKPVDTASRAEAHANTMKKIRKEEIESKIGNNFRINLNPIADKIDEFVSKQKTAGLLKNEGQLAELKAQADKFRRMGEVDGADGEFIKEMLNSQINNRGDASLGDVYKNGLKEATKTLGQSLDDTFSAIPGQFAEAKRRFGALKATYQDVVKADIKAQKAKGLGLGETFGRIEGIGDIAGAIGGLVTGKNPLPQLASGFGKLAVGKVLAKIKDKDFLIQEGFEGLSKKIPVTNTVNISKKGTQLGLPLLKQTAKAPTAITPGGVIKQTPVTPKPTPKTPPITVEKGAIGMGTPKVNNTPVIPPKATVAPSVSAPKNKIEHSFLQETKKYKTSDDFIEYLRTSIDDYTEGDRLTAKPKGLEKQRLDFIDYIQNKYPNKSGWASSARQYFNDVVSKNNVAPKKGMPKLGKEIMEQNNLIQKRGGGKGNDIQIDLGKGLVTNDAIKLSQELKGIDNYVGKTKRYSNDILGSSITDIKVGDVLSSPKFISSANKVTKDRGKQYGKYEIIINSETGKDITKIKGKVFDVREPEVLFDRWTKFTVEKIDIPNNKVYLSEKIKPGK